MTTSTLIVIPYIEINHCNQQDDEETYLIDTDDDEETISIASNESPDPPIQIIQETAIVTIEGIFPFEKRLCFLFLL